MSTLGKFLCLALVALVTVSCGRKSGGLGSKRNALNINADDKTAERGFRGSNGGGPTCTLRLARPGNHPAGTISQLIFEPGADSGDSAWVELWDERNPASGRKRIDPITARQILINPPAAALFRARYEKDNSARGYTCEVAVNVESPPGAPVGSGMIVVMTAVFRPPPIPVHPPRFVPFSLRPSCSNWRRPWGKRVAYDIYPGGKEATVRGTDIGDLHVVLSFESQGEIIFARIFPRDKALFNGGYRQPVPADLIEAAPGDRIDVRMCIRSVPRNRPLTEDDFDCSTVNANRLIGMGKRRGGRNIAHLAETVATFTKQELLHGESLQFWNHRGRVDGSSCLQQYSPLVLDVLGDGILTSNVDNNGVRFDLTASGEELQTGWIAGSDDAFLVRDLDNDGYIRSGKELFGEFTGSTDGTATFENGFAALASLDSNKDGRFSRDDSAWSQVKLWFASGFRRVGTSPRPVLHALDGFTVDGTSYAVNYIDLNYYELKYQGQTTVQNGNLFQLGSWYSLQRPNGDAPRSIIDVWFRVK